MDEESESPHRSQVDEIMTKGELAEEKKKNKEEKEKMTAGEVDKNEGRIHAHNLLEKKRK